MGRLNAVTKPEMPGTLRFHPIAEVFPMMGESEYQSLVEDIRKHGLLEPITLHQGQILDGRNRYRACLESGVTPRFQEWDGEGGSLSSFVWSMNAERRQLTVGQRAIAAQALMPHLEREAKARYNSTVGRPQKSGRNFDQISEDPFADTPVHPGHRNPRAADYAAKLSGINPSTIYQAKALVKEAARNPKAAALLDQVKEGEMSVWAEDVRNVVRRNPPFVRHADQAPESPSSRLPAVEASTSPVRVTRDVTREIEDEIAAERRRSRAYGSGDVTPPPEDASDAMKAMYAARPVRSLLTMLAGARMDMARQNLTISREAMDAWWDGVEPREWERVQEAIDWLEINAEPLLAFLHYKIVRHSVPPMVKKLNRRRD